MRKGEAGRNIPNPTIKRSSGKRRDVAKQGTAQPKS